MRLNIQVEEAYAQEACSPSPARSNDAGAIDVALVEEPSVSVCARFGKRTAADRHREDEIIGGAYSHA